MTFIPIGVLMIMTISQVRIVLVFTELRIMPATNLKLYTLVIGV